MTNSPKIDYPGVPFIDIAQMVICGLIGLNNHFDLDIDSLEKLIKGGYNNQGVSKYGTLEWINENFKRFQSYSMIFGTNNPRVQSSYKIKDSDDPDKNNREFFKEYILKLIESIKEQYTTQNAQYKCEICGRNHNLDYVELWEKLNSELRQKLGLKEVNTIKTIGRDVFPLIGTLSDASVFGNMSRSYNICARCLLVPYYLFFIVNVIEGKISLPILLDQQILYKIIQIQLNSFINDVIIPNTDKFENPGKSDRNKFFRFYNMVWKFYDYYKDNSNNPQEALEELLSKRFHFILWLFTNSGQGAELEIKDVPDSLVDFAFLIKSLDLDRKFNEILDKETKRPAFTHIRKKIESRSPYNFHFKDIEVNPDFRKIIIVYYVIILGRPLDYLEKVILISEKVRSYYTTNEIERREFKKFSLNLKKAISELIESGKIDATFLESVFGYVPYSKIYSRSLHIIDQFSQFGITKNDFDQIRGDLELLFDNQDPRSYMCENEEEEVPDYVNLNFKLLFSKIGNWVLTELNGSKRKEYLQHNPFNKNSFFVRRLAIFGLSDAKFNSSFYLSLFDWKADFTSTDDRDIQSKFIFSKTGTLLNWYLRSWLKSPNMFNQDNLQIEVHVKRDTNILLKKFDFARKLLKDYLIFSIKNKNLRRTETLVKEFIKGQIRLKTLLKFCVEHIDEYPNPEIYQDLRDGNINILLDNLSEFYDFPNNWMHPLEAFFLLEIGQLFNEVKNTGVGNIDELELRNLDTDEEEEIELEDLDIEEEESLDEEIDEESLDGEIDEELMNDDKTNNDSDELELDDENEPDEKPKKTKKPNKGTKKQNNDNSEAPEKKTNKTRKKKDTNEES